MTVYPAIDIKQGRCVRLKKGDMSTATDYGEPYVMAKKWQNTGAKYLHIVDLDAAFSGTFENYNTVEKILKTVDIPMQLGGGIRTMEDIDIRLSRLKISRVIIGTAAYENPRLIKEALTKYPGRVAVGIDAKEGRVALKGWAELKDTSPFELALKMKETGVDTVIYTDIMRDGVLTGPNIPMINEMLKTGLKIIVSGGISGISDVAEVKKTGAAGVIIGRALYTGDIDLKEALKYGG